MSPVYYRLIIATKMIKMPEIKRSSTPSDSQAINRGCECEVCSRVYHRNDKDCQCQEMTDIRMPDQLAYKFMLDQAVNSRINGKIPFQILDTFFFEEGKLASFYHRDKQGRIVRQPLDRLRAMESILRNHSRREELPKKDSLKIETKKDIVARKMRNNIGVMTFTSNNIKVLNELNMSFEISTSTNINHIKTFNDSRSTCVYYNYNSLKEKDYCKRARNYVRVLTGEITNWDILFVSKEEETRYEYDLFSKDKGKYLTYLTCKLCCMILLDCILVKSGVFEWIVDEETTAVILSNVQSVRYSIEKDPNQQLQRFIDGKRQKIETKLKSIKVTNPESKPSSRVRQFERILTDGFNLAKQELVAKIELKTPMQSEMDQAFKKLHPEANYNLSDIITNNQKFNSEMKKMFVKRFSVTRRTTHTETPNNSDRRSHTLASKAKDDHRSVGRSFSQHKCVTEQETTSRRSKVRSHLKVRSISPFCFGKLF